MVDGMSSESAVKYCQE